jgi:hypothetical protein
MKSPESLAGIAFQEAINLGSQKNLRRSSLRHHHRRQFITIDRCRAKQDYTFGLSIASDKSKKQFIRP